MILGIDTTTTFLHLALVEGDRTWTQRVEVGVGRSHSTALLPALNALLNRSEEEGARARETDPSPTSSAHKHPKDLTGVAACVGPGGFTSLRIGVATAEGLALTGLPTWGFSAFELRGRALQHAGFRGPIWILLDGQRGDVFAQRWNQTLDTAACKHPIAELPDLLQGQPWWTPSEFAPKLSDKLKSQEVVLPNEGEATLQGLVALCRECPSRPEESPLVPFYLRETDAEIHFPESSRHLTDALRQGHAR